MRLTFLALLAFAFLPTGALLAADPSPSLSSLAGSYTYHGFTISTHLVLDASGRYRYEVHQCMGDDRTSGTWRLRGGLLVLTQTSSRPRASSRDSSRHFVVIAEGAGWALVPRIFTDGRYPTPSLFAMRRGAGARGA